MSLLYMVATLCRNTETKENIGNESNRSLMNGQELAMAALDLSLLALKWARTCIGGGLGMQQAQPSTSSMTARSFRAMKALFITNATPAAACRFPGCLEFMTNSLFPKHSWTDISRVSSR